MRSLFALVLICLPALSSAQAIYQSEAGQRCIDAWITEVVSRLNTHVGTDAFNLRKPWSVNQYGVFEARGVSSAFEPDNWAESGGTRPSWMWNNYKSEEAYPSWDNEDFRLARVPGLRSFVRTCVGDGSAESVPVPGPGAPQPGLEAAAGPVVPEGALCPPDIRLLDSHPGVVLGCRCAPLGTPGRVWGSHPYTSDSALCTAAVHAGAVEAQGGVVWATVGPGQQTYSGIDRNGVTSQNYGAWGSSLVFPGLPGSQPVVDQIAACPGNMQAVTGSLTCHCSPEAVTSGSVWGTGTYTNDSALCRAALHAGAVGGQGGTVTAVAVGDPGRYTGSTANGVTTNDYGAWRGAFVFR